MTILIQNGQVINPATGMNEVADVLVENGVVSKIEKGIKEKADRKINAKGCFVMPGFIDMHVHLLVPLWIGSIYHMQNIVRIFGFL